MGSIRSSSGRSRLWAWQVTSRSQSARRADLKMSSAPFEPPKASASQRLHCLAAMEGRRKDEADLYLVVSRVEVPLIQEAHRFILHLLCEEVDRRLYR